MKRTVDRDGNVHIVMTFEDLAAGADEADGPTTVASLIGVLSDFPPEYIVVMSRDAEGNRFRPLVAVGVGLWDDAEGEFYDLDGGGEVPELADTATAVCLWPS
jgi:hypothetical protein